MKTFFKHLWIDYKMSVRDKTLFLMSYLFPLMFFLFMGVVMTSVNESYKEVMYPSMIVFSMLISTVLIIPNVVVANKETGIYRSFKIYGVKKTSIIGLLILSNFINVMIVSLIITLVSQIFLDVPLPIGINEWLIFISIGFLLWFVLITLAILLGILVKNSKHTVMYTQLLFLPSILLGGVMIEQSVLPKGMQTVGLLFPTTHGMNIFNDWVFQKNVIINSMYSLIVLIVLGIVLISLDLVLFKYDDKN